MGSFTSHKNRSVKVTALHADLFFFVIRGFVHQNNVESVATVPRCVCVGRGGGGRGKGGHFGSQGTGMIE